MLHIISYSKQIYTYISCSNKCEYTMYVAGLLHWSRQGGQKHNPSRYRVNIDVFTYVLKKGFSKSSL